MDIYLESNPVPSSASSTLFGEIPGVTNINYPGISAQELLDFYTVSTAATTTGHTSTTIDWSEDEFTYYKPIGLYIPTSSLEDKGFGKDILSSNSQIGTAGFLPNKGTPGLILRDLVTEILRRENKYKILRILLNNKEYIACPDSGSIYNIILEAFAINNNLEISRNHIDYKLFELGSGVYI
jgi:hypothetical protein